MTDFTKAELEIMKKYNIQPGKVFCKCGKPAVNGEWCWKCHGIKVNGLAWVERRAMFEIKYR